MHRHLPSIRSCAALSLLFVLLVGFCRFAPEAVKAISSPGGFKGGRDAVVRALPGRMPQHDRLVSAAGLFARLAGWRLFNGVVKLENGMLGRETRRFADPRRLAERLERSVREKRVPYLFVLAPCKMDAGTILMPRGLNSSANEVGGRFLKALADRGVETLDLRTSMAGTPRQVEECFYRADLHWNLMAAWQAAAWASARIAALTGEPSDGIQGTFAEEAWVTWRADRQWSGYMAKRAGPHFGGKDAVAWRTPRRTTDMRRTEADGRQVRGGFSDAVVERDAKLKNSWAGVVGGRSRSLVVYENESAPSDRTVLVVKDSFGRPVAAYLSVAFRRVIAVDPRRLPSGRTVGAVIREMKPDVVVEIVNAELVLDQTAAFTERSRGYFVWD